MQTRRWIQSAVIAACSCMFSILGFAQSSSQKLMPDVSLDGLFALSQFNRSSPLVFSGGHDPKKTGFNLQQVELTLGSSVDPYFRADANLVLTGEGTIEVEEAYATTLDLPANLQLKAGQFFTAFGRNNPVHPHAWDWANKPLILGRFFGGDGLRNPGAQVSWLSPLPWYSEFLVSAQNSTGENMPSFKSSDATAASPNMRTLADLTDLARWNNFFALSERFSLNLGGSFLFGPNNQSNTAKTKIAGGDLFFKFREPGGLSFVSLQVEFLKRYYDSPAGGSSDWGMYAQLLYRLPRGWERWHVGARYDLVGPRNAPVNTVQGGSTDPTLDKARRFRVSPVVTFYPSEFSKLRLQYDYDRQNEVASAQHAGTLQFEFLIGAHGAHKF